METLQKLVRVKDNMIIVIKQLFSFRTELQRYAIYSRKEGELQPF